MEEVIISSTDNYKLSLNIYESKNPKNYIQIIHGMEEHKERYEEFAKYLCSNGYTVIISDLRGHGKNSTDLGYFDNNIGYELLIKDQEEILSYIKNRYKVNKINLFAHSMGTIIARNLLHENSNYYNKVVLSGYPYHRFDTNMGVAIAKTIMLFKGPKYYSKFLHGIAIDSFNKSIKNSKTNVDWLSYNEDNVSNYINDSLCGVPFKVSALKDLFVLVRNMNKKHLFNNVNKSLKILMIRGKDDPCTGYENGSLNSREALKNAGFSNIEYIDYENMRHEILNETNNEKVYKDVLDFYNQ